jgi:Mrp family chromosome partitioning ATPase
MTEVSKPMEDTAEWTVEADTTTTSELINGDGFDIAAGEDDGAVEEPSESAVEGDDEIAARAAQAEAFKVSVAARELLVSLQLRHPDLKSVLISGVDCDGAGTIAAALAVAAGSIGREVVTLHVEYGDGRESIVSSSPDMGLDDAVALSDVDLVRERLARVSKEGLLVASTSEFLVVPESRVLAALVEGVVLVAQANVTRQADLDRATHQLADVDGALLGSVYLERSLR